MTRRPMLWDMPEWSRAAERFPVGTYVRVTDGSTPTERAHPFARKIGRVTDTAGRMVTARFDREAHRFDADWLFPVRYVRVRFHGPGMSPNRSEFLGTRYVATGIRGDRMQYTAPADHSLSPFENIERCALTYARERLGMCNPSAEHWRNRGTGDYTFAVTDYGVCECSDEYGPCEWHGETMVSREGASMRTADELRHEFLTDVASVCREWPSPEFERDTITIGNALADNRSDWGSAWLPDDTDTDYPLSDRLGDRVTDGEAFLAAHGLAVWWEDGYRIVRVTGGPLAQ